MRRFPPVDVFTVAACWVSSGSGAPSWLARWSLAGSLATFGALMVPSVWIFGRLFSGVGSSAFFLLMVPSSETPYSA
ncbi:hypothetical protein [Streptomyces shaanxiensis]